MVENHTKLAVWTKHNAWIMLSASLLYVMYEASVLFLSVAFASFLVFIIRNREVWQQFGWWGGWANAITALRLLLIILVVWQSDVLHHEVIFVLGILTLGADGLDGYYARKHRTVSAFGDCFDKETDAFFVLAYGVMICQKGLTEEWVLIPGLLRYMYVMLLSLVKIKPEVPHPSFRRQFMGMWLMGTLLAPFVIVPVVYIPGLMFAIGMVLYSFGVDLGNILLQTREKVPH